MREDGFEFDKWLMTTAREFVRPLGTGPASVAHAGKLPEPFPNVAVKKSYPKHWGDPPQIQTRDYVELPGGYGKGSSTLANWIRTNLENDSKRKLQPAAKALIISAKMFSEGKSSGYYLDQGKWLAVNPKRHQEGKAGATFSYPGGNYHVTLQTVGESDGKSTYVVTIDDEKIGEFQSPLSQKMYEEGQAFHKTWKNLRVNHGAVVTVSSKIGSEDGVEFSRARWAAIAFEPADDATLKAAAADLAKQAVALADEPARGNSAPQGSPTKSVSDQPLQEPRQANGSGQVALTGERKTWHKVTVTLDGPFAHEQDNAPNPFTDYRMTVAFTHSNGQKYVVPGYFAADGDAANSSAQSGTKWRAHFAPDSSGQWSYQISFHQGKLAAFDVYTPSKPVRPFDGKTGSFHVDATDKKGRDLRAQGRLQYVGKRYLKFAGTGQYFLKVGADAPETLLGYKDFDDTVARKKRVPLKSWSPHVKDWQDGDPTWQDGKGKGLIGAVNYLSSKGCNAFSFLTYNAGGDGDNVWPFIQREDKLHYDCSKLDQWGIVFDHATARGMYLHFKMQETENDDHRRGKGGNGSVPESLDGGDLGTQRKLYCRELIARFGHNLALNWNLGEENTQSTKQQQAMIDYLAALDAYDHNIVIHTFPNQQDKVYRPLLGDNSKLTGLSLQNSNIGTTHAQTLKWVQASSQAGKPWVVAFDESGSAAHGQCPDLGYQGFDGRDRTGKMVYTEHEVRKQTLWGTLMAGGAGCEYYFGYQFAENDLVCEDWRSRDRSWDYCRIAIQFFHKKQYSVLGNAKHEWTNRQCQKRKFKVLLCQSRPHVPGLFGRWRYFRIGSYRRAGDLRRPLVQSSTGWEASSRFGRNRFRW